ncbi:MAG: hypothetical protein OXM02_09915 [Bacteroidota bacterium]|nr:hypothetical protein [Bacteroidota bacterium]
MASSNVATKPPPAALASDARWTLTASLPKRPGDRVKTDQRDAHQLASLYAHGLLPQRVASQQSDP